MKNILYIEDDASLQQLVGFMLERVKDVQLLQEVRGEAGIQAATEHLPDLILLDLSLPDLSGYQVLSTLKNNEATENIPVVAVSGDSLPEDIAKGLDAGFDGYLPKPIAVNDFYSMMETMLSIKR